MHTRADQHALIFGQVRHGGPDRVEREPALHHTAPVGTGQRLRRLDVHLDAAHLLGAHPVEPEILRDAIHPAVQPCSWLPLVDPRQGTHTSLLDEIVALVQVSGQGHCEAPQTRQYLDHPATELVRHAPASPRVRQQRVGRGIFPGIARLVCPGRIAAALGLHPARRRCARATGTPGSNLTRRITSVVLTLATLGAAVSSSMMKSWNAVRSGATHLSRKSVSPREHVAFAHQRPGQHAVLEGAQIGFRLAVQADHGEGDDLEADALLVQHAEVAGDHAGLLQRAHAPQARRRRDADLAREVDVADAAVGLQLLEDAPIGSIEAGAHGAKTPRRRSLSLTQEIRRSNIISRTRQKTEIQRK